MIVKKLKMGGVQGMVRFVAQTSKANGFSTGAS